MYDCIQGSVILPGGETSRPAHEMDSPVTTHPPWVPLHAAGAGPPTHPLGTAAAFMHLK